MSPGRFITFEGGDGSGKSTQTRLLAQALRQAGVDVVQTREPGGSPGAEIVRDVVLNSPVEWSPLAETLLHFAARAEHVAKTIRPALQAGQWVVCDRFVDSTMAYQGYAQQAGLHTIKTLTHLIDLNPDLTLVLDVSSSVQAQRRAKRNLGQDRYERQSADFHAHVNDAFRQLPDQHPQRCVLIAGEGGEQDVHRAILEAIRQRLGAPV